jgi:hypothetical protein
MSISTSGWIIDGHIYTITEAFSFPDELKRDNSDVVLFHQLRRHGCRTIGDDRYLGHGFAFQGDDFTEPNITYLSKESE